MSGRGYVGECLVKVECVGGSTMDKLRVSGWAWLCEGVPCEGGVCGREHCGQATSEWVGMAMWGSAL